MIKAVSLFKLRPGVTPEQFEKHYMEVHVPLATQIPGIRRYTIGEAKGKNRPYYRVAELYFDDWESMKAGFGSPQGKAVIADPGFHALIADMITIYFDEEDVQL